MCGGLGASYLYAIRASMHIAVDNAIATGLQVTTRLPRDIYVLVESATFRSRYTSKVYDDTAFIFIQTRRTAN